MIAAFLTPVLTVPGTGGIPTTSVDPGLTLAGRITAYEHTIAATFGFESCRMNLATNRDEALFWLGKLMTGLIVYGPDAETVWEGFLTSVDVTLGQKQRSVSLEPMANRMRTRYTTVNGVNGVTATLSDTASQALYGIKDGVLSLGTASAADAANKNAMALAVRKNPKMTPTSRTASGDLGAVQVSLTFAGWYATLGWLFTSSASTTQTTTTTQVQSLTTAANGVNAFLSTDYTFITASGITATEYIASDTTYLQKIEELLKQGNSSNQRLAWGIYEGRRWVIDAWAGATPGTLTYRERTDTAAITDAAGGEIAPWNIRPNAMLETSDLLDPGPVSTAQDAASRCYIERVTCRIDQSGWGVDLEPEASNSLDAILTRN